MFCLNFNFIITNVVFPPRICLDLGWRPRAYQVYLAESCRGSWFLREDRRGRRRCPCRRPSRRSRGRTPDRRVSSGRGIGRARCTALPYASSARSEDREVDEGAAARSGDLDGPSSCRTADDPRMTTRGDRPDSEDPTRVLVPSCLGSCRTSASVEKDIASSRCVLEGKCTGWDLTFERNEDADVACASHWSPYVENLQTVLELIVMWQEDDNEDVEIYKYKLQNVFYFDYCARNGIF